MESKKILTFSSLRPQSLPAPKRSGQMMKFGFPTLDQLKWRNDYVLSYDRRNRTAFWVFEHLTEDSCRRGEGVERKNCNFKCDPSVHPYFQSSDCDYKLVDIVDLTRVISPVLFVARDPTKY